MNWNPCDCFGIKLDDTMGKMRTDSELEEMVKKIDEIASEYGFSILSYGSWKFVKKATEKSVWSGTPLEKEGNK